jgi:hypothetical protein
MTGYDVWDQLIQNLAELQALTPDPARTARVRARCHMQLARVRRHSEDERRSRETGRSLFAPVLVLGACAVYVASLVSTALHLWDVF